MQPNTVYDSTLVQLPKVFNEKGNITAINNLDGTVPFTIDRVYYLYDIPGGEERGGHAHEELEQLIIAASGSFDITIDDGSIKRTFNLSRPYYGLYLPSGIWRELHNFSSGAICLVLASSKYDGNDYQRDYDEYLELKNKKIGS